MRNWKRECSREGRVFYCPNCREKNIKPKFIRKRKKKPREILPVSPVSTASAQETEYHCTWERGEIAGLFFAIFIVTPSVLLILFHSGGSI